MLNLTPVIRNLVIINVVVFIIQKVMGPEISRFLILYPIDTEWFRPYQFFTYMFAHGDFFHIFFNMMALASIGPILETYWGDRKMLLFYLATGIGAGVIYVLVNFFILGQGGSMLGASGAIYGVLMAFGMTFPEMMVSLFFFPIRAKYLVFVIGFLTYIIDRSGQVAHLAHFGGAAIGFVLVSYWRSQGRR